MTQLIDDEIRRLIAGDEAPADLPNDTRLEKLGYDSLDAVDLCVRIEDGFALPTRHWGGDDWNEQTTVGKVIEDTRMALDAKAGRR